MASVGQKDTGPEILVRSLLQDTASLERGQWSHTRVRCGVELIPCVIWRYWPVYAPYRGTVRSGLALQKKWLYASSKQGYAKGFAMSQGTMHFEVDPDT